MACQCVAVWRQVLPRAVQAVRRRCARNDWLS
jgi:hypothetical protein